jgi:hypothetical protein
MSLPVVLEQDFWLKLIWERPRRYRFRKIDRHAVCRQERLKGSMLSFRLVLGVKKSDRVRVPFVNGTTDDIFIRGH